MKIYNGAKRTEEAKEFKKLFLENFSNKYITHIFELNNLLDAKRPIGKHIVEFCEVYDRPTTDSRKMAVKGDKKPQNVSKKVELTNEDIAEASISPNQMGGFYLSIKFTKSATPKFAKLTEQLIGKRLAIIVDGVVVCAPNINEPIIHGKAQISGNLPIEELVDLANFLNSQPKSTRNSNAQ